MKEGYIPRIDVGDKEIYVGEGIVTSENNKCNIMAINTKDEDVVIEIDPREMIPFEYATQEFDPDTESEKENNRYPMNTREAKIEALKNLIRMNHLNVEEKQSIIDLLHDYSDIFLTPGDRLPCTGKVEHEIVTENSVPIHVKQYRHPPIHKEVIQENVAKKLKDNIIEPSFSPSNNPIWIVPKKPDSKGNPRWRMVIDFRELNKKTVGDAYPLPNIADIMDQLGGAMYFSTFDLASGFQQIPMKPEDKWKTAFSTPNGHYQYVRMPEGLKTARC